MYNNKLLNEKRQQLADFVVQEMEKGELPWRQGWQDNSLPYNYATKKRYKGVNRIRLWMTQGLNGWTDPRWMTFRQIEQYNEKVPKEQKLSVKGQKSVASVEKFRIYDRETKKDLDVEWYSSLSFSEQKELWESGRFQLVYRLFPVFNGEQIKNMPELSLEKNDSISMSKAVWNISKNMGVEIIEKGDSAYYVPKSDIIVLPPKETFYTQEDFQATALHELSHASGHPNRLGRPMNSVFGSADYAKEELRAEFGSFFTCMELGFPLSEVQMKNHAAYIQSWAKAIKDDKNELFRAIADADKITDYLVTLSGIEYKIAYQEEVEIDYELSM